MAKHPFLDLITGYETSSEGDVKGKRFVSKAISGGGPQDIPSKFSVKLTQITRAFVNLVSYTSTRTWGLLLGVFGLLTLLLHFAVDYLSSAAELSTPVMLVGAIFAVIAIPLLSFDKPMSVAMQEIRLFDSIFFEFFCIRRMQKRDDMPGIHPAVGLVLGIILAVLGAVLPIWWVVAFMLGTVYLFLTAISPEFSFFFIFLVMPYLPMINDSQIILACLVAVTMLSFMRKIAEGKRIYYFEQYDFLLLLMLIIVFISGVFIGGAASFGPSSVMLILGFGGYALTGSLVANRRLADCVIKANIISSLPISAIAIAELVRAALTGGIGEFGGSSATFDSPDMLGAFLLVSAAFMFYFVFVRRHAVTKLIYGIYLFITLLAMASTLRIWLVIALVAGLIAYFALKLHKSSWIALGAIAFIPYLALLLPNSVLSSAAELPILSTLGFSEYLTVWISSRRLLVENLFAGVGIGNFMDAPYTASFLLQIACEAGVIVLVVFIMIFAVRLRHRSIYSPYTKHSQVSLLTDFADITMVALLVYGLFTPLWSAPTVYYLFWCVFGLGSAVLRISKHEFDDRVGYFSDGAGIDSSSIDISLHRT